jgi:NACHT domain
MAIESALIELGTAAVRAAAKLWLGSNQVAAEVGAGAIDLLSAKLATQRDRRKFNRMIENFVEAVADRIEPIVEVEFRTLPENERLAAIEAVRDTFEHAHLVDDDLFASDVDARHLHASIKQRTSAGTYLLSIDGESLYNLLMRECCGYVIEISRVLPQFSPNALTELLKRDSQIIDAIREVLARLPQRDRTAGFDYDYRQLIARKLDHVELFGVTLEDSTRRYPLSVAYISLTVADVDGSSLSSRVEDLLAINRRLFIRGEAGLGKTTLLQWIAVRSARNDFPSVLADWNETIPFFVPLRRYSERELPTPENFLDETGRHIADEMPKGWVHEQLRSGRAILLVDGVDELAAHRRQEVRAWLRELVEEFSQARFVITSRPGATHPEWLRQEDFAVLDLEPMTAVDVRIFVGRWHQAMRSLCSDDEARAEIDLYERGMIERFDSNSHMRILAGYPLLCALLCALHKDRRSVLPSNRLELYEVALQMMLERRDAERKIPSPNGLHRTEKMLILSNLAYWLIRNGRTDIEIVRATDQIDQQLLLMPQVEAYGAVVYKHLLERSGLLREPVVGRVDFIHRTFQEYLAAWAAISHADDVGTLVANAHKDQWHEVVTMAVGHATQSQREELLSGLLGRADAEEEKREVLELLALACLETAPQLSLALRQKIHDRAAALLPPQSLRAAKSFASAGRFVLDLLARTRPIDVKETVATIRAIADTGLEEALPILSRYARDDRKMVHDELFRNWTKFDDAAYTDAVLSRMRLSYISLDNMLKVRVLKRLRQLEHLLVAISPSIDVALGDMPSGLRELKLYKFSAPESRSQVITEGEVDLPVLDSLALYHVGIDSLQPLTRLPTLRHLSLDGVVQVAQLWHLDTMWAALQELSLTGIEDLTSVRDLDFLERPKSVSFRSCHELMQYRGIDRWSETLTDLTIFDCPEIDLSHILSLKNLERLDLVRTPVNDISLLGELPRLQMLKLDADLIDDLQPIGSIGSVKLLGIKSRDAKLVRDVRDLLPGAKIVHLDRGYDFAWPFEYFVDMVER